MQLPHSAIWSGKDRGASGAKPSPLGLAKAGTGARPRGKSGPTPKGGIASIVVGLFTCLVARKPPAEPTKAEQRTAFLAAIEQLEALAVEIDLAWPEDAKADAIRRLNRIARAIRTAPIGRFGRK